MILRISSAIVSENQVGTYLEHVGKNVMPAYQTAVGLISVSLLRRQVVGIVEFLFLSIWQSNEALKRFLVPKAPAGCRSSVCQSTRGRSVPGSRDVFIAA